MRELDLYVSGSIASFCSTTILFPIDTIKSRLQAGFKNEHLYKNVYKGLRYEMISTIPCTYLYWYSYSKLRNEGYSTIVASCSASILSNIIDTPFDLYKKKKQLLELTKSSIYKYCFMNVLISLTYNMFYLNIYKKVKEKTDSNILSISSASIISTFFSYPFDRQKTKIAMNYKNNDVSYFRGLGYRLMYSLLYSNMNMNILLYFTPKII